MNKSTKELWEEFWKPICTHPNGSINLEQIKKELADYSFLLEQVPKVYEEVSGLSKVNYKAEDVIKAYRDKTQIIINDILDEMGNHISEL
jgi:hypothetical protein